MINALIKICGINDTETARQTAEIGADFIGLVFHPASPRYVSIKKARSIVQAIQHTLAQAVAVFVDQNAEQMSAICQATGIHCVQLHGEQARATHHLLPKTYRRFYVPQIKHNHCQWDTVHMSSLDPKRDYLLIDHFNPGHGQQIDWEHFKYDLDFPWLLAGGLTAQNVVRAMQLVQPHGVDVSSGVEKVKGIKDLYAIQQFISAARNEACRNR